LIESGQINFDVIKESNLLMAIINEAMTLEELSALFSPNKPA
jgi:hypothetical protein